MNRFKRLWNNPKQMGVATIIFLLVYIFLKIINSK